MQHPESKSKKLRSIWLMPAYACIIAGIAIAMVGGAVAKPGCPGHPSCKDDDTSSGIQRYNVAISGDLAGSGTDWVVDSGKDWVRYQHFWDGPQGVLTNLAFFQDAFTNGASCFPISTPLFAATLQTGRAGGASAALWFDGHTNDSSTEILYILRLDGVVDDPQNWPPEVGTTNNMMLTDWSMGVENEGKKIKNISCLGEGDTDFVTYIYVTGI